MPIRSETYGNDAFGRKRDLRHSGMAVAAFKPEPPFIHPGGTLAKD
ncbi:hypothetical protein SXCC_02954 [Gluconacetobacter sp. SXCC-1]|nr:hypothetical protein SXCC_02954 [Gluconacetobacter sp. SXCC-1]